MLAKLIGSAEVVGEVDWERRNCWRGFPGAPKLLARLTGSAEVAGEVDQSAEVAGEVAGFCDWRLYLCKHDIVPDVSFVTIG